jgi:hypothetical protein
MDPDPDSDPDPAIFVRKKLFFSKIFAYYFLKVHLHNFINFFRDKKSYRSHKTVGINVFLTIFA